MASVVARLVAAIVHILLAQIAFKALSAHARETASAVDTGGSVLAWVGLTAVCLAYLAGVTVVVFRAVTHKGLA